MADRNVKPPPFVSEVPRVKVSDGETNRAFSAFATTIGGMFKFLEPYIHPEGWTQANFGPAWAPLAYASSGRDYHIAASKKSPFNRVWLRGLAERASGTDDLVMTLPRAHWPTRIKRFLAANYGGGAAHNMLEIHTDGSVHYAGSGHSIITLDGISFDLDDGP
ncbi:MAG: hypothetical protein E6R04_06090 [Spirochaetes bacterium]|nr:MAG: hypothetical protein E6R04_06090 [Spirochaetota bacterium]